MPPVIEMPMGVDPGGEIESSELTAAGAEYASIVWEAFRQDADAIIASGQDVGERLRELVYKEVAAAFAIGYLSCLGKGHPLTVEMLGRRGGIN